MPLLKQPLAARREMERIESEPAGAQSPSETIKIIWSTEEAALPLQFVRCGPNASSCERKEGIACPSQHAILAADQRQVT